MRNVINFARVSRGERTQDPKSQTIALDALASRQGWHVVENIELKQSAWNEESAREAQAKALQPIIEGKADTLCVWSLDRISREGVEETFRFLRQLEQHYGASFYSLQEPFLSTAGDPQQRELMLSLLAWMAKWESQRKSERLKACAHKKRAAGGNIDQRPVWGGGSLLTDDEVNRAHALRAQGRSIRQIAAELATSKSAVHRVLKAVPPSTGEQSESSSEVPAIQGPDLPAPEAPSGHPDFI